MGRYQLASWRNCWGVGADYLGAIAGPLTAGPAGANLSQLALAQPPCFGTSWARSAAPAGAIPSPAGEEKSKKNNKKCGKNNKKGSLENRG